MGEELGRGRSCLGLGTEDTALSFTGQRLTRWADRVLCTSSALWDSVAGWNGSYFYRSYLYPIYVDGPFYSLSICQSSTCISIYHLSTYFSSVFIYQSIMYVSVIYQ